MIFNAKTILFYMNFGNGSQNDDFIFNRRKLPTIFEEEVIISLNLDQILERTSLYLMQSENLTLATV